MTKEERDAAAAEVVNLMPEDTRKRRRDIGAVPRAGRRRNQLDENGKRLDPRERRHVHLGRRWTQIYTEVESGEYTWDEFVEGLDAEELVRGQLKDYRGGFSGRPPSLVPRAFHLACQRELKRRFDEKVQDRLLDATDELIQLSKMNGGLQPKDRAKVLMYLMERVMGPIPKQVNVTTDAGIEGFFAGVLRKAPADAEVEQPYTARRSAEEIEDEEEE